MNLQQSDIDKWSISQINALLYNKWPFNDPISNSSLRYCKNYTDTKMTFLTKMPLLICFLLQAFIWLCKKSISICILQFHTFATVRYTHLKLSFLLDRDVILGFVGATPPAWGLQPWVLLSPPLMPLLHWRSKYCIPGYILHPCVTLWSCLVW